MSQKTEVELKLALAAGAENTLLSDSVLGAGSGRAKSQRVVTTYFDTSDKDLARRGLSLRIRQAGDKRIQSVKVNGEPGAAHSRGEWEWPVDTDTPDLRRLKDTPVADCLDAKPSIRLLPAVVTDVVRTTRIVRIDGSAVEVSLDSGVIVASGAERGVHELELELQDGKPGAIYRLALELHSRIPFEIEAESKAARGFRLHDGSTPSAKKFAVPKLSKKSQAIDALCVILEAALGHLIANRTVALANDDEGIHQTRIAIRRLRSVLRLFGPVLEPHAADLFNERLRSAGRVIGEARDWDVFCSQIQPRALRNSRVGASEAFDEVARKKREAAHAACGQELRDPSFTGLVLGLAAWSETGRESRRLVGDKRLRRKLTSFSPELLDRLDAKVAKRGRAINSDASAESLHPLRKSLKKLRYGAEFVGSLYGRKNVKRFLSRVEKLQDVLGEINDAAMGTRSAAELARGSHLEFVPSVALIAVGQQRGARKAFKKLPRLWKNYRDEPRFWR